MKPAPRLALLPLLALALAGCNEGDGEDEGREPLRSLADLGKCDFRYPDDSLVDCRASLTVSPEAEPPQSWFCVGQAAASRPFGFELWSSGDGDFGVRFWQNGNARVGRLLMHLTLEGSEPQQTLLVHGDEPAFIRFPEKGGDAGNWTAHVMEFEASGTEPWMTTDGLEVRTTVYQGWPWHVWVFHNGTTAQHFVDMLRVIRDGEVSWHPPTHSRLIGEDYDIELTYWEPYGKTTLPYAVPMRPLELDLPLNDPCG